MATSMSDLYESERARDGAIEILRRSGRPDLAEAAERVRGSSDLSSDLGEHLESVAAELEKAAVGGVRDISGPNTIDFATALRLYGPAQARRGRPLPWREGGPTVTAVDADGVRWDIVRGRGGYGLIVAYWDRPDWWVATLEEAKALASEKVARPSFSTDDRVNAEIEIPFD